MLLKGCFEGQLVDMLIREVVDFSLALDLCHVGTRVVWGVGRDCGLLGLSSLWWHAPIKLCWGCYFKDGGLSRFIIYPGSLHLHVWFSCGGVWHGTEVCVPISCVLLLVGLP